MPVSGVAHNLVLVRIDKTYPGQGMKVLNALFGAGQMMFSKYIVALSNNVPLNDYRKVAESIFENVRFNRDILILNGPLDVLDHSSDTFSLGGKMGIDATIKMPEERDRSINDNPEAVSNDFTLTDDIVAGLKSLSDISLPVILISVKKPSEGFNMKELVSILPGSLRNEGVYSIAVDNGADTNDLMMISWLILGNTDPSRDFYRLEKGGIFIDATSKSFSLPFFSRRWPNVVSSDRETVELVDRRWSEYGIGDFVASPSLKLFGLIQPGGAAVDNKQATT